jgi:hypothetical protein
MPHRICSRQKNRYSSGLHQIRKIKPFVSIRNKSQQFTGHDWVPYAASIKRNLFAVAAWGGGRLLGSGCFINRVTYLVMIAKA